MLNQKDIERLELELYLAFKPKTIDDFAGLRETANQLCSSIILRFFHDAGIDTRANFSIDRHKLVEKLSIISSYHRLLDFFLVHLLNQNVITVEEEKIVFKNTHLLSPNHILKKISDLYPKFSQFFSFLERCSLDYLLVFSGVKQATEVLFPTGDSSVLERIYQNTPKIGTEDLYLNLVKDITVKNLSGRNEVFEAIEVGGGQGILTRILLPSISQYLGSYTFTDISQGLVNDAKEVFGSSKNIYFKTLDISKDPQEQGYNKKSYSHLYAFNVIHATENVKISLEHCISLVKKGGWIFLVETTRQQPWIDMIYGLFTSWWHFNDQYRSYSPLLEVSQWKKLLQDMGVEKSIVMPIQRDLVENTDTCIIAIKL